MIRTSYDTTIVDKNTPPLLSKSMHDLTGPDPCQSRIYDMMCIDRRWTYYRYVYGIPQVHIRAKVTRASNKGTLKDN
jgi:hypothetical protein